MPISVRRFLRSVGIPAFLALSACGGGGGGGGDPDIWYHFICNGDSECLTLNPLPSGTPSGSLNQGPGNGGQAGCNSLMNFGRINWNIPPAEQWCDNSPKLNYPKPSLTFTVTPASIVSGQSANLSWSSTRATSCTASGAWSGTKGLGGNQSVSPAVGSHTYTLSCTGAGGTEGKSVMLVVKPPVTFTVTPSTISLGDSATLDWSSSETTSCTASGAWSGTKGTSGNQSVTPATSTSVTYTLTCTGAGGTSNSISVTLAVAPQLTFTVTPNSINLGSTANLSWSAQGASSCSASMVFCTAGNSCSSNDSGWNGTKATSGSESRTPSVAGTYTYTLTCNGGGGESSDTEYLSAFPAEGSVSTVRFNSPAGITTDSQNNLYVGDSGYTIRKITPAGVVTTFAGSGAMATNSGSNDDSGVGARFRDLLALSTDGSDNVHLTEYYMNTIRRVHQTGAVVTYAGAQFMSGSADGYPTEARFNGPQGIVADKGSFTVYIADTFNRLIRKYASPPNVTTLAGAVGQSGTTDGSGPAARFISPQGLVLDPAGNLYVADSSAIRVVTPAGDVSTLVSGVSGFANLNGIARDSAGNLYVANLFYEVVYKVSPAGAVSTFAGTFGVSGSADGNGTAATFHNPYGLATDSSGNVYVTDRGNHTVRKIAPNGDVTTFAGLAGAPGTGN